MKVQGELILIGFLVFFVPGYSFFDGVYEDAYLLTPQLIQKYGYVSETHSVDTSDGYILELHRIRGNVSRHRKEKNRKPVLIMHGLQTSSADWVLMGPKQGLGYLLADNNYDVWLGNARGNRYSRQNVWVTPQNKEFWRFSWHQIGTVDIPHLIDYILLTTGFSKLSYIGFSQGTTSFFVLASEKPNYLSKISHMQALSPVAFIGHTKSPLFGLSTIFASFIDTSEYMNGPFEFITNSPITKLGAQILCRKRGVSPQLCRQILFMIGGFDTKQINETMLPVIVAHSPAGSSSMQFGHYGQNIISNRFRQFDYGSLNYAKYGQEFPPDYNITKATIPVALHYSDNDDIAQPVDVFRVRDKLPNLIGTFRVDDPKFAHLDFLYGVEARELVYNKVVNILNDYS